MEHDGAEKLASPLIAVALYASCVPVVLGALWSARAADARAASRYLRGFAAHVGLAGCVALTLGASLAATLALTPPLLGALGARPFPSEPALESRYARLAPASIEFCEPNFRSTGLVAEPHNVVSSVLGLVGPGAFGLAFAAPRSTGGLGCVVASYACLSAVGVGSARLHTSLAARDQAGDELPMLWFNAALALCFARERRVCLLYTSPSPRDS